MGYSAKTYSPKTYSAKTYSKKFYVDVIATFIAATGITDATQIYAINYLVMELQRAGLLTKFFALYPFVGGTASTHSYNLVDPSRFQITWINAPTQSANGVQFNGTTQYGKTGLIPGQVVTHSNTALHYYSRTAGLSSNVVEIGAKTNIPFIFELFVRNSGGSTSSVQYAGSGGTLTTTASNSNGMFSVTRRSATSHQNYRNGVSLGSNATTAGSLPNHEMYIGAENAAGTPVLFSTKQSALAGVSTSMTTIEAVTLYGIVQQYQTILARQV